MSFYRPEIYRPSINDLPPPPPPPELPPLPKGPPPPANKHRGGDSWRPPDRDSHQSQRAEFTFRNSNNAPEYPCDSDQYRPTRSRQYAAHENEQAYSHNHQQPDRSRDDDRGRHPRNLNQTQRGRGYRVATADRPLLRLKRGDTPERMMGMVDDQHVSKRFLPADDVSDSGEEQMDESETDLDQLVTLGVGQGDEEVLPHSELAQDQSSDDLLQPPLKRRALGPDKNGFKEDIVPKWSNPDPYTVLPPVDESQRKRKDVVKIIRKARIVSDKEITVQSQVVSNADFISFGGEAEISSAENVTQSLKNETEPLTRFPKTASARREFSHLQNLHVQETSDPDNTRIPVLSTRRTPSLTQPTREFQAKPETFTLDTPTYDPAVGNEGSEPPNPRKRKRGSGMANGSLAQDWVPVRGAESTPWLVRREEPSENAGFR